MNGTLRASYMVRGSRRDLGGLHWWDAIQSFFANTVPASSRVPIVALVVSQPDRNVLLNIASQESLDVCFAESCEEGLAVAKRLKAPMILFDRNWPATEWRPAVE